METKEIVIRIITWIVSIFVGIGLYKLAQLQIKSRCEKIPSLAKAFSPDLLNKKNSLIVWVAIYVVLVSLAVGFIANPFRMAMALLFIFCGVNIAAVDLAIRRIPNELLIVLLVGSAICNILECLVYKSSVVINITDSNDTSGNIKNLLIMMVVGLVLSFIVYMIPKKFGVYIGNGDIKLSSVIGFALGIVGYMQAMILMAVFMLIYLAVLLITKKGGLKTKTPMGPALSFGAIISVIFPVLVSNL